MQFYAFWGIFLIAMTKFPSIFQHLEAGKFPEARRASFIVLFPARKVFARIGSFLRKKLMYFHRNRPENYRPISLISSLSTVFEKLLLKRMMSFCQKHKILNESQFGFWWKMSCVQAIAKVTEFLRQQIPDIKHNWRQQIEEWLNKPVSLISKKR